MAQPVWTLSVDLQAKTAAFTTGLADAAKGARGSFQDIRDGAADMGKEVGGSVSEARHGVMLLGEEFGVHLPRALTSFIASIGPIGAAMEAAFPFLAIIVGATLLLEHLSKLKEEGGKLTESQTNFGTTVANVMNGLNEKLLQAGIRTDELNHNHLGALNKQLELIDRQSMNDLVQAFGTVSKAADVTFAQLKTSWYQWGAGSAGAKNALEQFKTQYDSLLAQGKDKEANDLLAGTRKSAEEVLSLQKQAKDNQTVVGHGTTHYGDYTKFEQAKIALQKEGIGFTQKEVEAQETLVGALQAQANVVQKVAELKAAQSSNARQSTADKVDGDSDTAARQQAANAQKEAEETQKLWEANYREAVSALQENERQKIEATEKGTTARLAVIDAAIKEENSKGLQETSFYRELLNSRIALITQMTEEERKLKADGDKEAAQSGLRMSLLQVESDREAGKMQLAQRSMTQMQILDMEMSFNAKAYNVKKDAFAQEIAALDQHAKDYENKKKQLNDQILALDKQFENQDQAAMDAAQSKQLAGIQSAENRMKSMYAQGFSQVLMGKMSFARMMQQLDSQIVGEMIKNNLQALMSKNALQERERFGDARTAAANAFASAGNPIVGALLAAGAFATVLSFQSGGVVPGVGNGDIVPAMLEPGEGVLTKQVMEGLSNRAKFGDDRSGGDTHVHHHATYHISAIDGASVRGMLEKHADTFTKHFHNTVRKMNR